MQNWEYKQIKWVPAAGSLPHEDGAAWRMFGGEGWELVSVLPHEDAELREWYEKNGKRPVEDYFPEYMGFFKRPIEE